MKALFTRDTRPHEGGDFKKGQTVEMSDHSFDRWLRRGAVEVATKKNASTKKTNTQERSTKK